jgi:hypothetical protein
VILSPSFQLPFVAAFSAPLYIALFRAVLLWSEHASHLCGGLRPCGVSGAWRLASAAGPAPGVLAS